MFAFQMITATIRRYFVVTLMTISLVQGWKMKTNCSKQNSSLPFLWLIRRNPPSYLFGSIHVPYQRVWNVLVAKNVASAFNAADSVYFEVDMADWKTAHYFSKCQLLPDNLKTSDILPRQLLDRLHHYLDYVRQSLPQWLASHYVENGLASYVNNPESFFHSITNNWNRKRPAWLLFTLTALTRTELPWHGLPYVDIFLSKAAKMMKKRVGTVENVRQQCSAINLLNTTQVILALNLTIKQLEYQKEENYYTADKHQRRESVVDSYLCGDIDAAISDFSRAMYISSRGLDNIETDLLTSLDEHFKDELLYRRNGPMTQVVTRLLRRHTNESLFFALGAAHFFGKDNIIDQLEQRGFVIERTTAKSAFNKIAWQNKKRGIQKKIAKTSSDQDAGVWSDVIDFMDAGLSNKRSSISSRSSSNSNKKTSSYNKNKGRTLKAGETTSIRSTAGNHFLLSGLQKYSSVTSTSRTILNYSHSTETVFVTLLMSTIMRYMLL